MNIACPTHEGYIHHSSIGFIQHDKNIPRGDTGNMPETNELHEKISRRLQEIGMTARAASLAATGKPDAITMIRRGATPSATRLMQLADVLGVEPSYLMGNVTPPPSSIIFPSTARNAPEMPIVPRGLARDVPIYGTALGADLELKDNGHHDVETMHIMMNEVLDYARRPPSMAARRDIYAVFVVGDSMYPRWSSGELAFVDPKRPPSIGDDVILQLRNRNNTEEDEIEVALIKRLQRRTGSGVKLEQFNPPLDFSLDVDRIASIHRVIPYSELLG